MAFSCCQKWCHLFHIPLIARPPSQLGPDSSESEQVVRSKWLSAVANQVQDPRDEQHKATFRGEVFRCHLFHELADSAAFAACARAFGVIIRIGRCWDASPGPLARGSDWVVAVVVLGALAALCLYAVTVARAALISPSLVPYLPTR